MILTREARHYEALVVHGLPKRRDARQAWPLWQLRIRSDRLDRRKEQPDRANFRKSGLDRRNARERMKPIGRVYGFDASNIQAIDCEGGI